MGKSHLLKSITLTTTTNKMKSVQETRNKFRLDLALGRVVFITLHYALYWWIFYGIWFIIPYETFNALIVKYSKLAPYYLFGVVPLISFLIPYNIRRFIKINPWLIYILHVILIALALFLFFLFSILIIYKNYIFI